MRPTNCGLERSKRILAALGMVVTLASPAWASIGVRHDTLRNYQSTLTSRGWKVRSGRDNDTTEHDIKQLIDRVLETFSKEDAAKVTAKTRRDIARIAMEAIATGEANKRTTLQTGTTGSLCYRVGIFQYESYYSDTRRWDRAMGRWKRTQYRFGLVPLIALMPRDPVKLAKAEIWVPAVPADAELFFDGNPTKEKGKLRHCLTPDLEVGKTYTYRILLRWRKDGKTHERSCTVSMSGGDSVRVNFFTYQGVPAKIPEVTVE